MVDKFYVATQARTIRGGSKSNSPVVGSTKSKSLVLVEEVIESGSSYWIKIKFSNEHVVN